MDTGKLVPGHAWIIDIKSHVTLTIMVQGAPTSANPVQTSLDIILVLRMAPEFVWKGGLESTVTQVSEFDFYPILTLSCNFLKLDSKVKASLIA